MRSSNVPVFLALILTALARVSAESAQPPLGVVDAKPKSGRFVQVGDRFMVPYKDRIPGTDVQFEMIPIPGGEFLLGSPATEPGRDADEGPQVRVQADPIWVGKCEVTQAEYDEYQNVNIVGGNRANDQITQPKDFLQPDAVTAPTVIYDLTWTYEHGRSPDRPAVSMTIFAAQQYTKWISRITGQQYRLPTEAEWEYACRAGSATAYPWGARAGKVKDAAWSFENSEDGTSPVAKKQPNAFGLHDMLGNVDELVVGAYDMEAYSGFLKRERNPVNAIETALWRKTSDWAMTRGGSIDIDAADMRSANRFAHDVVELRAEDPDLPNSPWWYCCYPANSIGFRVVRSFDALPPSAITKFWNGVDPQVHEDVEIRLDEGRGRAVLMDEHLAEGLRKISRTLKATEALMMQATQAIFRRALDNRLIAGKNDGSSIPAGPLPETLLRSTL